MDNLTADQRKHTMRAVRSTDTGPELAVRRMIFSWGYRYRLHARKLPGCPDMVFPAMKKTIFIHGCFWHGHSCRSGMNRPSSNTGYWDAKLERNRLRDAANRRKLRILGWNVLVLWECELRQPDRMQRRIRAFLERT